jgi:hypothetical protein
MVSKIWTVYRWESRCRERCFDRGENGMMNEKQDMAQFQDSLFYK